jgi:hypothetical protein
MQDRYEVGNVPYPKLPAKAIPSSMSSGRTYEGFGVPAEEPVQILAPQKRQIAGYFGDFHIRPHREGNDFPELGRRTT